jgi:hypothetical protein
MYARTFRACGTENSANLSIERSFAKDPISTRIADLSIIDVIVHCEWTGAHPEIKKMCSSQMRSRCLKPWQSTPAGIMKCVDKNREKFFARVSGISRHCQNLPSRNEGGLWRVQPIQDKELPCQFRPQIF